MKPHVALIILNYNGTTDTIACLESLTRASYPNFTVILIDNASTEAQVHLLEQALPRYPFVRYLRNTENLGFAGGCNQGMQVAIEELHSSYMYLLNNDTVVDPAFLDEAVTLAETNPSVGLVSSQSRLYDTPHLLDNAGHTFLDCGDVIPRGRNRSIDTYSEDSFVMGACGAGMLIRAEVIAQVGMLREEFFINFEDGEFGLRTIMYGWDCIYTPKSIIYHKINASIRKVRSHAFNVRSLVNQFKAYYYNIPFPVLLCNAPIVLLRDLGIIISCTLFGRWTILHVFFAARLQLLRDWKTISHIRRSHRPHWKRTSWFVLCHQHSFIATYIQYTQQILFSGQKSVLEERG